MTTNIFVFARYVEHTVRIYIYSMDTNSLNVVLVSVYFVCL